MHWFKHRFFNDDFQKEEETANESVPEEKAATPQEPKPSLTVTKTETTTQEDGFEVIVPKDEAVYPLHPDEQAKRTTLPADMEEYDPRKDLSTFRQPTTSLLKVYNTADKAVDMEEQNENKNKIIHTLRNYGIEITSIKATVGPTITLYEIVPQAGVRISKIRNLEDDIALSLSALGIRIIAPMPGKGTIGIEVPNKEPQIVSMHSVITSKRFQESAITNCR